MLVADEHLLLTILQEFLPHLLSLRKIADFFDHETVNYIGGVFLFFKFLDPGKEKLPFEVEEPAMNEQQAAAVEQKL